MILHRDTVIHFLCVCLSHTVELCLTRSVKSSKNNIYVRCFIRNKCLCFSTLQFAGDPLPLICRSTTMLKVDFYSSNKDYWADLVPFHVPPVLNAAYSVAQRWRQFNNTVKNPPGSSTGVLQYRSSFLNQNDTKKNKTRRQQLSCLWIMQPDSLRTQIKASADFQR